jgi:hypothetical protein
MSDHLRIYKVGNNWMIDTYALVKGEKLNITLRATSTEIELYQEIQALRQRDIGHNRASIKEEESDAVDN